MRCCARSQAEQYARALPAAEGRPPFVMVVDVGNVIELHAEFSRSGATYTPYPDPRSHRIRLADLADAAIRERLRMLWTDPAALDPSRRSAKVTREVAERLAEARAPLTLEAVAARFAGRDAWKKRLAQILETLIAGGRVRALAGGKGYVTQ